MAPEPNTTEQYTTEQRMLLEAIKRLPVTVDTFRLVQHAVVERNPELLSSRIVMDFIIRIKQERLLERHPELMAPRCNTPPHYQETDT